MGHMAHLSDHFQLYGNISLFSIPIELVTNAENLVLLIHCLGGGVKKVNQINIITL